MLEFWEERYSRLSSRHRDEFLRRSELEEILTYPDAAVRDALERSPRLSDAVEFLRESSTPLPPPVSSEWAFRPIVLSMLVAMWGLATTATHWDLPFFLELVLVVAVIALVGSSIIWFFLGVERAVRRVTQLALLAFAFTIAFVSVVSATTFEIERVERINKLDWGTEIVLSVSRSWFGVTYDRKTGVVMREFSEPGYETVIEVGTRNVGPRIGAICADGWRSKSTGSGTCSHHGGVRSWTHKTERYEYEVKVPIPPPSPPAGVEECENRSGSIVGPSFGCSNLEWSESWDLPNER